LDWPRRSVCVCVCAGSPTCTNLTCIKWQERVMAPPSRDSVGRVVAMMIGLIGGAGVGLYLQSKLIEEERAARAIRLRARMERLKVLCNFAPSLPPSFLPHALYVEDNIAGPCSLKYIHTNTTTIIHRRERQQ
jgi:hypothetical protein